MKKILYTLLALTLVLALEIPALAGSAESTGATQVTVPNGQTATSELRATIEPMQLKVTVPSSVEFTMDITVDLDALEEGENPASAQIFCPEHAFVNESYVPVYARVASVSPKNVKLTNDPEDLKRQTAEQADTEEDQDAEESETEDRYIMLAYKSKSDQDKITNFNDPKDWMTENLPSDGYWLSQAPIPAKSGDEAGKMDMTLYGQAGEGWEKLDFFTISAVIVVSTEKTIPSGQ